MDVHKQAASEVQRLPAGRHGLSRATIADSQRGRVLLAMAQAVADRGYAAATVADVLARARVSRATFYQLFRDKAECYEHAYATASQLLAEEVQAAVAAAPSAAEALRASLRTYLEQLQQDRTYARAFVVEVHAAPLELQRLRWAAHRAFAERLQELAGAAAREAGTAPPPDLAGAAAVGALVHLVCETLQSLPERDLNQLRGPLEAALSPLLIGEAGTS